MMIIYPEYYNLFKCIAGSCPDTCCAGWEVVIDKKFENIYKASHTPAAKKAVSRMYTDSDGDLCLRLSNGRCPMLNGDNLCEIYIDMGKDALCDVCKNYPRFFKECSDYTIAGLSVSCPEAARIILTDESEKKIKELSFAKDKNHKIFFEIYNLLTEIILGGKFFCCDFEKLEFVSDEMIFNKEMFCADMVHDCFNSSIQTYCTDFAENVFAVLCDIEYLTKDLQELIKQFKTHIDERNANSSYAEKCASGFKDLSNTIEIKNFAIYFLYKYMWEAIEDQSIELWIKRATAMAKLACELYCFEFLKSGFVSPELKQRICQLISKEIEHNNNNLELFDEFCM